MLFNVLYLYVHVYAQYVCVCVSEVSMHFSVCLNA